MTTVLMLLINLVSPSEAFSSYFTDEMSSYYLPSYKFDDKISLIVDPSGMHYVDS